MVQIPSNLQNPEFKFFLCGHRDTDRANKPIEKAWNSTGNYRFFSQKLKDHPWNYGICTGKVSGNLIVLDFDDKAYYLSVADKLPPSFTVRSAGKGLPHMYYILKGEMFRKDHKLDPIDKHVLVDIQADGAGAMGPGSMKLGRSYDVVRDVPIVEITEQQLKQILQIPDFKRKTEFHEGKEIDPNAPEKIILATKIFRLLQISHAYGNVYACPLHSSAGNANLAILPNGKIYCFHEDKIRSLFEFAKDVTWHRKDKKMWETIKIIHEEHANGKA